MKPIRRVIALVVLALIVYALLSLAISLIKGDPEGKYPIFYNDIILKYARENEIDPFLVAAVIRVESNYHPEAHSHMNAHGLMQILPDTAEWIANRKGEEFQRELLTDPEYNIRFGTFYLKYLKDHFNDWELALAAYNAGLNNVESWLNNPEYSKDGKNLDHIPFPETRNYVKKIREYHEAYHQVYHDQFPEN